MDDFVENKFNSKKDVIASYQQAIVDTLIEKVRRAIKKTNVDTIVIAGGVAANQCLRKKLKLKKCKNNISRLKNFVLIMLQ